MFIRAGPAVVGLRAPRTATPELRECRLTGGDASVVAWTVAARRASSAACRARRRSTPASLRCSATGRLFLEVRRVDRRLLLSCLSSSLSNVRWSPRLLGLATHLCQRRSSDDSLPARPLAASSCLRARLLSLVLLVACSLSGRGFPCLGASSSLISVRISVPSCPVRCLSGVLFCWLRGHLAVLTNRGMLDGGAGVVIAT